MAEFLFAYDTLLLHGSAIAVDGQGYLLAARSGTGKSTHTRLWRQVLGDRAIMINDDKPFLRVTPQGVMICGAPWSGKHGLDTNITVPLRGICLLERCSENRIRKADPREVADLLEKQGCPPLDPDKLPKYQALIRACVQQTPVWHLACNKLPQAAVTAYEAMSG